MKNKSPMYWYLKLAAWTGFFGLVSTVFITAAVVNFADNADMNKAPTTAVKVWTSPNTRFVDFKTFAALTNDTSLRATIMSGDAYRQAFAGREIVILPRAENVIYGTNQNGVYFTTEIRYDDTATHFTGEAKPVGKDWIILYGRSSGLFYNVSMSLIIAFVLSVITAAVYGILSSMFIPFSVSNAKRKDEEPGDETPAAAMA
jgi:hypothetical protein